MVTTRGTVVEPVLRRLSSDQIAYVHQLSLEILSDPGLLVFNEEAVALLDRAGAKVTRHEGEFAFPAWKASIPARLVSQALETAPSVVRLGARDPANVLELDASVPRVFFGSGSETNVWLEVEPRVYVAADDPSERRTFPTFRRYRGSLAHLCQAARLGEHLEHLDFFLRPVNIQDEDIDESNKDVNKFFACLDNTTKHVMAGLTSLEQLDNVVLLAELVAGGPEQLRANPVISFITCCTKSPLQLVEDATQKMLEVVRRGLPVVLSSSPQGGSTAPIDEVGMVAQINAEILACVVVSQLARPGAPVLYGSVPVRARMDNLHDMYGVPEVGHYNVDCAQMAAYYGLPCYSTAGVSDACLPGVQAVVEKMLTYGYVTPSGPQLIHYAFGLLEETQTFCPEQAVLDNWQIGMVKYLWGRRPRFTPEEGQRALNIIRQVMATSHRLYARYTRQLLHRGEIFPSFPFPSGYDQDEALLRAHEKVKELLARPVPHLPEETVAEIFARVPGLLPRLNPYAGQDA